MSVGVDSDWYWLREIARLLAILVDRPIGWVDIVSGIVVPVLLGALTLWVAIQSTRIARTANQLTAEGEERRRAETMRQARTTLASEVNRWGLSEIMRVGMKVRPTPQSIEQWVQLRNNVETFDDPSAGDLRDWVSIVVEDLGRLDNPKSGMAPATNRLMQATAAWTASAESYGRFAVQDLLLQAGVDSPNA